MIPFLFIVVFPVSYTHLVADEPVASLDVSIQAQVINLFRHLQKEHGFTFLFIAHDLAMVEFLCDRVGAVSYTHLDVYKRQYSHC